MPSSCNQHIEPQCQNPCEVFTPSQHRVIERMIHDALSCYKCPLECQIRELTEVICELNKKVNHNHEEVERQICEIKRELHCLEAKICPPKPDERIECLLHDVHKLNCEVEKIKVVDVTQCREIDHLAKQISELSCIESKQAKILCELNEKVCRLQHEINRPCPAPCPPPCPRPCPLPCQDSPSPVCRPPCPLQDSPLPCPCPLPYQDSPVPCPPQPCHRPCYQDSPVPCPRPCQEPVSPCSSRSSSCGLDHLIA